ncbi:MAG: TlpA disulfide reductase family protein [Candidatus Brocadiia bacterium]
MHFSRILSVLVLSAFLAAPAVTAEEVKKYPIEYSVLVGSSYGYDVKEQRKTLAENKTSGEALIFAISLNSEVKYAVLPSNGAWLRYVEQRVFKGYNVDEASTNGMPLDAEKIKGQTEAELKTTKTEVFSFGVMSSSGEPDQSGFDNSMEKAFALAAGGIMFLPKMERAVGEEWSRAFTAGDYEIRIGYILDSVKVVEGTTVATLKGQVTFPRLPQGSPIAGSLRNFAFEFDLDTSRKIMVKSQIAVGFKAVTEQVSIMRIISDAKQLKDYSRLDEKQLEKADRESGIIQRCKGLLKNSSFADISRAMEDILKTGDSIFDRGIRAFLTDEVYPNWPIDGRKVENFWFTDWLNGKPVSMADCSGKYVLIAFFDPSVPASTRIWKAWDDWSKNFSPKGLVMIAVTGAPKDNVKKYLEEYAITYPIALDGDAIMTAYFRVEYVPSFIVLDKDGKVILTVVGKTDMFKVTKKLEEFFGPLPPE